MPNMSKEDRYHFLREIYNALFDVDVNKPGKTKAIEAITLDGKWGDFVKKYKATCLRDSVSKKLIIPTLDVVIKLEDGREIELRCIVQNPNTPTNFGRLAKKGERIMWVIDRKARTFIGRIHTGQWHKAMLPKT